MRKKIETKFLFKEPLNGDWAYKLWALTSIFLSIFRIATDISNGTIYLFTVAGAIAGLIDAVSILLTNAFLCYVVSLFWLIPRRDFLPQSKSIDATYESKSSLDRDNH